MRKSVTLKKLFFNKELIEMLEMPQSMVEMALKTMGDRWKVMII